MIQTSITQTKPYNDQKPGTSGLRKPTKSFEFQKNYTENFIASILATVTKENATLIVGGDGRYFMLPAVQKIIDLAAATENVGKLIIGQNGILSTPAASNLIIKKSAAGGILLTASHNPGGPENDFGIKFNCANGGPAPSNVTDEIFEISKTISSFKSANLAINVGNVATHKFEVDLGKGKQKQFIVEVVDSVLDYENMCQTIFDFEKIRNLFQSGFKIRLDCMHGVMGPYATKIVAGTLNAGSNSVVNNTPSPTFNNGHPDPNLKWAKELVDFLKSSENEEFQFGAAFDGDGDRNMVLGQHGFFITPSDSLALIAEHGDRSIPYFKQNGGIKGIARSMPTSAACDKVALALGVESYQTPTGWKYFGALMDSGKISLCGEESFGTGSTHIREKDGLWAVLAWLSILADNMPIKNAEALVRQHWQTFGRHYYCRWDYEGLTIEQGKEIMDGCEKLAAYSAAATAAASDNSKTAIKSESTNLTCKKIESFSYTDLDGTVASKQGIIMKFYKEDSYYGRSIIRLSGTGSSGATLRLYLERYDRENLDKCVNEAVGILQQAADDIAGICKISGRDEPTVIT